MIYIHSMFEEQSKKKVINVLIEASIVGICLVLLVKMFSYTVNYLPNITNTSKQIELVFVSGFMFHMLFEYTGLNVWYSIEYCKLLM
jgi:cation transporter-like permease